MLENLLEYYRKSDGATKKKILGCIFAEKLILENGRVATSTFTEPIQFIINVSEVLGISKKNKRSILTSCAVWYPERDLNPHNRNGHRILSPACLPFHHPGGIKWCKFRINNS